MLMEIFTRDNGRTTKRMGMVATLTQTEQLTLESGKMTNSMEREWKPGLMEPSMKANIRTERSMGKEPLLSLMGLFTQEISFRTRFQEGDDMFGQMVKTMKDLGRKIKCMGTANSLGKTESGMKGIS